jgi:hypothetical protein
VESSVFSSNGLLGLTVASQGNTIDSCTLSNNKGHGLSLDTGEDLISKGNVVRDCTFTSNDGDGVSDKGEGGNLLDWCFASLNKGTGLNLKPTDMFRNCVSTGNVTSGGANGTGNVQ